jgi:hypothetical protein
MKEYDKARSVKKEEPQASLQGQQKEVEAVKPSVVSGP